MSNGYWENMVKIDMTTESIEYTKDHMQYVEEYLGGRALGIKMLWEALKDKPDIDPLGPENPLMLIPGVATGVGFPTSASRGECVCKSPLTMPKTPAGEHSHTVAYSSCGGKFHADLKFAGIDMLYITGQAKSPKVIVIDNGAVSIIDGSKYWGMDTNQFEETIQKEYGDEWKALGIGPAGEKLVRYACILNEAGRAFGRVGVGAVMGSKMLKGIICRGNKAVPMANVDKFIEKREETLQTMLAAPVLKSRRRYGTGSLLSSQNGINFTVKNWTNTVNPHDDAIGTPALQDNYWVRHRSCWGCPVYCMKFGVARSGEFKGEYTEGPEFESGVLGSGLLMDNMGSWTHLMDLAERQGFDQLNLGGVLGLACECYEKGIIKSSDVDGLKLEWGNADQLHKFAMNIINKKDEKEIYGWFAMGAGYAASKLGPEAMKIAPHVKNHVYSVQMPHLMSNTFAFSTRGGCHLFGASKAAQEANIIRDLGGHCNAPAAYSYGASGTADINSFIMGISLTLDQYMYIGEKCINIEKMFNCLNGFRAEDDDFVDKVYDLPIPDGKNAGKTMKRDEWAANREAYYTECGWDPKTGKPTEGKLQELGLNDMIPYLAKIPF